MLIYMYKLRGIYR